MSQSLLAPTLQGAVWADAPRIIRRWDTWLLAAVTIGAIAVFYVQDYVSTISHIGIGAPGSWGPLPPDSPPVPQAVLDAMLLLRAPFTFPQNLLTVLNRTWPIQYAAAFIAVVTIGADFEWGTIRTAIAASGRRTTYLRARMINVTAVVVMLYLAALVVVLLHQGLMAVTGERFPAVRFDLVGFLSDLFVRVGIAVGLAVAAALFTAWTRSVGGGLLLSLTYVAVDNLVSGVGWTGPLRSLSEATFLGAAGSLADQVHAAASQVSADTMEGALVPVHVLSVPVALLIAASWISIAGLLLFRRLNRMDITS
jgi:hypothetical protein